MFFPCPRARKRQRASRGARPVESRIPHHGSRQTSHSTFCTCSRTFSSSAFSATTTSETAGPSAFEPDRVHFPIHFLKKKIQLAAARLRRLGRARASARRCPRNRTTSSVMSERPTNLAISWAIVPLRRPAHPPGARALAPEVSPASRSSPRRPRWPHVRTSSPSSVRRASRSIRRYPPSRTRIASSSSSAAPQPPPRLAPRPARRPRPAPRDVPGWTMPAETATGRLASSCRDVTTLARAIDRAAERSRETSRSVRPRPRESRRCCRLSGDLDPAAADPLLRQRAQPILRSTPASTAADLKVEELVIHRANVTVTVADLIISGQRREAGHALDHETEWHLPGRWCVARGRRLEYLQSIQLCVHAAGTRNNSS